MKYYFNLSNFCLCSILLIIPAFIYSIFPSFSFYFSRRYVVVYKKYGPVNPLTCEPLN